MSEQLDAAIGDLIHGRMTRRQFVVRAMALGVSAGVIGALLQACQSGGGSSSPQATSFVINGPLEDGSGGTLVIGQESDMDVLDPALGTGAVTWRACLYSIYESLVTRELDNPSGVGGKIIPNIVDSVDQSSDGKVYTYHLHPGISFTDGTPFDATAVKWNVERQWDQSSLGRSNAPQFDPNAAGVRGWFWGPSKLQNIVIKDANTIVFELGAPFAEFVSGMIEAGLGTMGITSPKPWQTGGSAAIAAHPTGTGPFLFKERVVGDHVTLVKNPNYWNPATAAKADQIIFKILPDAATRVQALRSGDVHVIFAPPPTELESLQKSGFIVTARPNPHIWYLSLNAKEPYWQDKRVRQAFWMSINREGMAKDLLKNSALPGISVHGRTSEAWSDSAGYPAYDPTKAKQLMKDAGLGSGFDTTFQISTGGSGEMIPVPMAEWIASDAAKIGINIKLQQMEWITYLHTWAAGMTAGIGLNQQSWGMTSPFWPNLPLRTTSGLNVGHQPDTRFDGLMDEANSSLDPAVATAKYKAVDILNAQEMWFLPIVNDLAPVVISSKVKNFVHTPDWWWDFRKVWVKG